MKRCGLNCGYGVGFGVLGGFIYYAAELPWYTELSVISMCFVACIGAFLKWSAGRLLQCSLGGWLAWLGRWTLIILIFHPLFNLVLSHLAPVFSLIDNTGLLFWFSETVLGIAGCLLMGVFLKWFKLGVLFGVRV
jgi:hypothetical protein